MGNGQTNPDGGQPGRAYLGRFGYKHDIFISYRHGTKEGEAQPLRDWSRRFQQLLITTLAENVGDVSVYFDESLRPEDAINPMAPLEAQLVQAIEQSAMLQVHVSARYHESAWCKRELEAWEASLPRKPGNSEQRISVIRMADCRDVQWPDLLQPGGHQLPGHLFHDADKAVPWEFLRGDEPPGAKYADALITCSGAIARRLRELHRELTQRETERAQVSALQAGDSRQIYLHARRGQQGEWEKAYEDLENLGLEPSPSNPAPDDEDTDAWENLTRMASRCDAMLMVGSDPFELDDDLDLVGRHRRAVIRSKFQRYLPCAVLDRADLRTRVFEKAARRRDIDWLDGKQPGWQENVQAWLTTCAARAADKYGVTPPPDGEPEE